MSFTFNWPRFSDQFHYDAIQMLNTALNKGNKPPVIADKIEVVELEMGTQPPELEIRDIGDLTVDQFRGIFRLTYSGDAHIVLKTKVQANPLNHKQPDIHLMTGSRGMLAAKQPLVVPMLLRLSHFKLNSYVVLVVSKQKGITLVFKTDPLQNVDINSTFDSIAVIQKFIQREIEGQLRQMFREDLPGIIHRLSQQWVKAKVEAPYLAKRPPPPVRRPFDTMSNPDMSFQSTNSSIPGLQPRHPSSYSGPRRPRSASGASVASTSRLSRVSAPKPVPVPPPDLTASNSDLDNFDPTYGLRPEGLPLKSVFGGFSSLFTPSKGLADLAEEPSEVGDYEDEGASFDFVDWDGSAPDITSTASVCHDRESVAEYETIPAVGGGTITRPRIYHSHSSIQSPSEPATSKSTSSLPTYLRSGLGTPGIISRSHSALYHSSFSEFAAAAHRRNTSTSASMSGAINVQRPASLYSAIPPRPTTPDSLETQPSYSSGVVDQSASTSLLSDPAHQDNDDDAAIYIRRAPSDRRLSISSSNLDAPFSSSSHYSIDPEPKIVLRPSLNNSIHQLSTLSHSNHTLSPYTRSLEHFTVRSVPPRGMGPSGLFAALERQPVKAKRKRMYRLGGKPKAASPIDTNTNASHQPSSPAPSEFDASDMDLYFRSHEDLIPHSPDTHPTYARRRQSNHAPPPPPPLQ